jgi:hypothetical protein
MKSSFVIRTLSRLVSTAAIIAFAHTAFAQTTPPPTVPDTSKMTYNQMSQGLKLYVYPAKGQSQHQQKEDEFECYNWAIAQSGIDPLNLPKVEAPPAQSGPTGGAIKGAARGAAAGAAIGAITGDAGQGAAVGAAAGAMAGRRAGKQAQAQQNQQAQANTAAQEQAIKDSFTMKLMLWPSWASLFSLRSMFNNIKVPWKKLIS